MDSLYSPGATTMTSPLRAFCSAALMLPSGLSALRPSQADRLARRLLIDDPGDVAASVMGLAYVVDAASQRARQDADGAASILEVSASAVTQVLRSRSWKTVSPARAMVAVADAVGQIRPGHGVERELVHVAYLAAHAASKVAALVISKIGWVIWEGSWAARPRLARVSRNAEVLVSLDA